MVRPFILAAVLTLAAGAASATPDPSPDASMAPAFTGTIISTYPDGRQGKLWLSQDGAYKAAGRRGDLSSGHWTLKADKVCLKQSRPIPTPFSFCTPKPISTTWKAKAVSGEPISVRIEQGGRS